MKQTLKVVLLICILGSMAGCRLAVIVVEGGGVQGYPLRSCPAGEICVIDVDDPYFSTTFTAIPDEGWYFERWQKGERFFCGGSTDPQCTLSFEGHEETEAVQEIVDSSEMFYIMPIFGNEPRTITDTIIVDGNEWAQIDLFKDLTWDEINSVCPEGKCRDSGLLNFYDMTGWTWASVDEVNALLNQYMGSEELGPGPESFSEINSKWAPAFFNDGWRALGEGPPSQPEGVGGWLHDRDAESNAYNTWIEDAAPGIEDLIHTVEDETYHSNGNRGGWFYRILE